MTYVTSGRFLADLEHTLGSTLAPEPLETEENDPLATFPDAFRAELQALRGVWAIPSLPKLCVLTPGDFWPVPALTGEDRDEVLEDWFDGNEESTDFVMKAVDILNGGGGFYVLVHPSGRMGLLCEDPYSFDPLDCTLESFLRALVAAHGAVCERGLDAGKSVLAEAVGESVAKLLLTFAGRLAPKS
ncbi:MAG: hypothetical protein MUE69_20210 [Myxococcota bacterium]|jgi:hypothetical protein|nr:hypothetical protein [Myxococcota bacterium]